MVANEGLTTTHKSPTSCTEMPSLDAVLQRQKLFFAQTHGFDRISINYLPDQSQKIIKDLLQIRVEWA